MKNMSIRLKITLWFAAALILVVSITYLVVLTVSNQVIQKTVRDSLIETVTHNVDEIEFYKSMADVTPGNDVDHFIVYRDGFLEIDDDFLDEVNSVYTGLYEEDGTLLYGENPISRAVQDMEFLDGEVQQQTVDQTLYYIFDTRLTNEGLEGLWLRGIVSEDQGSVQMHDISKVSLVLLPLLVLLALAGGYLIAKRMLRPVEQISEAASRISRGDDLKKRIDLGEGRDELHRLADSFNEMIARLDRAFEAERQFTSDASHELRTPMSVIMAQCEYSLEEERDAEEYRQALGVIQRQGRKMSKLINDMLDFIRLEIKKDSYPKKPVDMTELTESLCDDMALIQEKGIMLTYEAEKGVTVIGNGELLARLLTNLVSNAYRYGRENGHIHVRLETCGRSVALSVADDGIGIAPEEQEKIFRRFYQVDGSRTGTGTGLGLSMAWEIAQFHGGSVRLESTPGQGSTFTFVMPLPPEEKNPDF